jgi:isopenicillin N synthase-like dioxygenase
VGKSSVLEEATSLFGLVKKFFDLGVPEKQKYSVTNNGESFGWVCFLSNCFTLSTHSYKGTGRSFVDKQGTPDANEFYNPSKDDILNQLKPSLPHPDVIQAEHYLIKAFILHSHAIVLTLLRHISACLGLHPTRPKHNSSANVLPSLHRLNVSSEDQISFIKYPGSDILQPK